jgi:hypothetical protein
LFATAKHYRTKKDYYPDQLSVMPMQTSKAFSEVDRLKDEMAQTLMELVRIPAIAPDYSIS